MRGWIGGVGIIMLLVGAWPGAAWPADAVKIGFIDLQKIIENSEKGKEFRDKILALRSDKERILMGKQEEIRKMRDEFQQKALTLNDRARLDKEQEIRQKELEFQNLSESYRQEVLMEGRKLQTLMFKDLSDVVRQIGQRENFTVIVDKDATLFVSDSIDITDKVIQMYNSGAGATGTSSSGAKKK